MKKAKILNKKIAEDREFARRTRAAWKRIQEGKGVRVEASVFLEELKKW